MTQDEFQQCYNRALFLLGRRAYSSHKLSKKLSECFSQSIVTHCINALLEKRYLDDESFLENRWRQNKKNGYSDKLLAKKYIWEGFSRELVDKVYEKITSADENEEEEEKVLEYLKAKKSSLLKKLERNNPNYMSNKHKIFRHLLYKGHSPRFAEKILKILTPSIAD